MPLTQKLTQPSHPNSYSCHICQWVVLMLFTKAGVPQ